MPTLSNLLGGASKYVFTLRLSWRRVSSLLDLVWVGVRVRGCSEVVVGGGVGVEVERWASYCGRRGRGGYS